MKNIVIWRIMAYFSQENISLVSFSLQQLTIIRNKIVPLHCVRKQAALVAKCSNKFGISLVCTAFVLRKRGELLDGKATSKRAGRCLHMHAASESGFVKQIQFFHDSRERTLERQKWSFFLPRNK